MSRESKAKKNEIQHIRNAAYQDGWDDGYAEGFGKAMAMAIDAFPSGTPYGRGAKSKLRDAFEAAIRAAAEKDTSLTEIARLGQDWDAAE